MKTGLNRREFLRNATLASAAALLPGRAFAADAEPTRIISLGKALKVPLLGIGTGVKGGQRSNALWRSGRENFDATIRKAYDEGVRLFDAADMYGSLPHIASALKGKPRDSYVLITKIWCHAKGGIPADEPRDNSTAVIERSLKEAGTDYIDLMQLHCQTDAEWTTKYRSHMDQLAECKKKGMIRAHGCSCHSIVALEAVAADPWVDVVHTRINPWGVKMDGPADQVVPVLKKIHNAGKGVIGMKLVGEGTYGNDPAKINEALKFVLGLGCVDAMVVGFEKPDQIADYKARVQKTLAA